MMDRSWNPADYSQAEDRVFRIGQTRSTVWVMRPEMRLCGKGVPGKGVPGKGVPPLQTLHKGAPFVVPLVTISPMNETKDEKKMDETKTCKDRMDVTPCDVECTLIPTAERRMVDIIKNKERVQQDMVESGTRDVCATAKDVQKLKQVAAEESSKRGEATEAKKQEKNNQGSNKKPRSSVKTTKAMDTSDDDDKDEDDKDSDDSD